MISPHGDVSAVTSLHLASQRLYTHQLLRSTSIRRWRDYLLHALKHCPHTLQCISHLQITTFCEPYNAQDVDERDVQLWQRLAELNEYANETTVTSDEQPIRLHISHLTLILPPKPACDGWFDRMHERTYEQIMQVGGLRHVRSELMWPGAQDEPADSYRPVQLDYAGWLQRNNQLQSIRLTFEDRDPSARFIAALPQLRQLHTLVVEQCSLPDPLEGIDVDYSPLSQMNALQHIHIDTAYADQGNESSTLVQAVAQLAKDKSLKYVRLDEDEYTMKELQEFASSDGG